MPRGGHTKFAMGSRVAQSDRAAARNGSAYNHNHNRRGVVSLIPSTAGRRFESCRDYNRGTNLNQAGAQASPYSGGDCNIRTRPAPAFILKPIKIKICENNPQLATVGAVRALRRMLLRVSHVLRRDRRHYDGVYHNPRQGCNPYARLRLPPLQAHEEMGARGQNQNVI